MDTLSRPHLNAGRNPGDYTQHNGAEVSTTADKIREVFANSAKDRRWVAWRWEEGESGRRTKPPVNPHTGGLASPANPKTWGALEEALAREGGRVGIIAGKQGAQLIICADLDACRNPETGEISSWAQAIIDDWGSYTEVSPSGTGVKIFALGDPGDDLQNHSGKISAPKINGKQPQVELFARQQYLTVTGQHLAGTPLKLAVVRKEKWDATKPPEPNAGEGASRESLLVERLRDALTFIPADERNLWANVGMALKLAEEEGQLESGLGWALFDEWSKTCPEQYDEKNNERQWKSFRRTEGNTVKLGSVFHWAKEHGWPGYVTGKQGPVPLGYLRDDAFAIFDQQRQEIRAYSPQQLLSTGILMGLAGRRYWARQFPSDKGLFNSYGAGDEIMEACRRLGPFDPAMMRGRGVWREGNRVIINLGDPVPDDTEYRYLCFQPLRLDGAAKKINPRAFLEWLRRFTWRNPSDAMLAFGWYAFAPICGAVDWRPHIFIHAPAKTGKTTLHNVGVRLLTPLVISADGGSSEAGIRQSLGTDSLPVMIDELESDHDHRRLQSIMKLMRSASSANNPVLKGTPEGKALTFAIRTTFCFSAINPIGGSEADDSRIVALELERHDGNAERAREIERVGASFEDWGPSWCRRAIDFAELLAPTLEKLENHAPAANRRHVRNITTLLGAAWLMLEGRVPTEVEAKEWMEEHRGASEAHAEAQERDDALECLEVLLSHKVRTYSTDVETSLRTIIADARKEDDAQILEGTDLRIKDGMLMLRLRSNFIDRCYAGTKWRNGTWKKALQKVEGAVSGRALPPQRFGVAGLQRALAIPGHHVWSDEEDLPPRPEVEF